MNEAQDSRPVVDIDVFSDVVCPWCFVGTERLEHTLASLASELSANVVHHPFYLMPETPPEGIDIPSYLRRKYGVDPRQLFARVEAEARKEGIDLDLMKQPRAYPTAKAHTLLRHAAAKQSQRALARTLFHSYFIDAEDISDPDVLARLAARHGFTEEEAKALVSDPRELEETERETGRARELGIGGVPFFVFGGKFAVSGAQPTEVFRQALTRAVRG